MYLAGDYVVGTMKREDVQALRKKMLELRDEHDIEPDMLAERFGLPVERVRHLLNPCQWERKR